MRTNLEPRSAARLWPDEPADEVSVHIAAILEGEPLSTLPLTLFVAEREGTLIGFVEVGLRSHAEGWPECGWDLRPVKLTHPIQQALHAVRCAR